MCFLADLDLTIPAIIIGVLVVLLSVGLFGAGIFNLIVYLLRGGTDNKMNGIFMIAYAAGLALILWVVIGFLSVNPSCGGNIPCAPPAPPSTQLPPSLK
jgi:hypothetical protein